MLIVEHVFQIMREEKYFFAEIAMIDKMTKFFTSFSNLKVILKYLLLWSFTCLNSTFGFPKFQALGKV